MATTRQSESVDLSAFIVPYGSGVDSQADLQWFRGPVLTKLGVITREADVARSTYKLVNYSTVGGWAMMPRKKPDITSSFVLRSAANLTEHLSLAAFMD